MIAYFPNPYKDEILPSIIGRYIKHTSIKPSFAFGQLFGGQARYPPPLYNSKSVIQLIENASDSFPYSFYQTIDKFTNASFFYQAMSSSEKANFELALTTIENSAHECFQLIPPKYRRPILHYCPICNEENRSRIGELYWNRIHQLPDILVCPYHGCFLEQAEKPAYHIQCCIAPDKITCPIEQPSFPQSNYILEISKIMAAIALNNQTFSVLDYRKMMVDYGYHYRGRFDFQSFFEDFGKFMGTEINLYKRGYRDVVTKALIYGYKKYDRTVSHLILQYFFNNSTKSTRQSLVGVFGPGPWICYNRLSDHYGMEVITDLVYHFKTNLNRIVGVFTCACGFKYKITYNSDVPTKAKRYIIDYGKESERKIRALSERDPKSKLQWKLRQQTRHVMASIKKIRKEQEHDTSPTDNTLAHRKQWQSLIEKEIKLKTISEIRTQNSRVYGYLIRYDNEWLLNFNKSFRSYSKKRITEIPNEDELIKLADQIILNAKKKNKKERISRDYVLRKMQRKLPGGSQEKNKPFISKLDKLCEGYLQFQIRKVGMILDDLLSKEITPTKYLLMEKLGLTHSEISLELVREIEIRLRQR